MTISGTSSAPELGHDSQVLAVVDEYREAEAIVKKLADREFPVEHTRIVGDDLQWVEHVTGRLTLWSAVGRAALGGAFTGLLICWLFALFSWLTPIVAGLLLALYGLIAGAIIGGIIGAIGYALIGSRRNFVSAATLRPSNYEVLVDTAWVPDARRILHGERSDSSGSTDDTATRDGGL
ncbi:MAG: hypothetical protein JWP85_10 [Rhodoglobus sp.]|nr:hypothetical protein [Rhodoglobus sp.]